MDTTKLKKDMKALEERIRQAKAGLRTTWTRPMGAVQLAHLEMKKEVTELYILRAWLRGKQHLNSPGDLCKEIAERRVTQYRVEAA
jgi:hypothetical protein